MSRATTALVLSVVMVAGCESLRDGGRPSCRDRSATLNQVAGSINITRPEIRACRGDTVRIRIVPPVTPNSARAMSVANNPPGSEWLNQPSINGMEITIVVSQSAMVGTTYKYSLEVDGVGLLDPTIRIIN